MTYPKRLKDLQDDICQNCKVYPIKFRFTFWKENQKTKAIGEFEVFVCEHCKARIEFECTKNKIGYSIEVCTRKEDLVKVVFS